MQESSVGPDLKDVTRLSGSETESGKLPKPASRTAFAWYLLGCGGMGFLVGYFAGLSESPIVATTIPLLFALLGGGGGLYVARADLKVQETVFRIRLLGISLAAFTLACVIGGTYGASIRTGSSWRDFFPFIHKPESLSQSFKQIPPEDEVMILALRTRLQLVGASESETKELLDKLVHRSIDRESGQQVKSLVDVANERVGRALVMVEDALRARSSVRSGPHLSTPRLTVPTLQGTLPQPTTLPPLSASDNVLDLRSELIRAKAFLESCQDDLKNCHDGPAQRLGGFSDQTWTLGETESKLNAVTADVNTLKWFATNTKRDPADLLYCQISLKQLREWLGRDELNQLADSIDTLLDYLGSPSDRTQPPTQRPSFKSH